MTRFCGNCGTEVDETAVFCPTCGQPIDQDVETELPAAPGWPDPDPTPLSPPPAASAGYGTAPTYGGSSRDEAAARLEDDRSAAPSAPPDPSQPLGGPVGGPSEATRTDEPPRSLTGLRAEASTGARADTAVGPREPIPPPSPERPAWDEPTRPEARPPRPDHFDDSTAPPRPRIGVGAASGSRVPPPADGATSRATSAPPPARETAPAGPAIDLPVTMPVTLSAWLIGVGAAVGAIGALISLFDRFGAAVDLVAFVSLAAVALSVFFSASVPAIPHVRLITLAVVLVAFGIGIDRLGFAGASGVGELLLFLGSAAAVIGAILVEVGRDQPLGPAQR